MKSDLDSCMQADDIDALLVMGAGMHNPPMVYLTGGGHFSNAELFKKRGAPARLYCWPMERDEAALSGLEVHPFDMQQLNQDLNTADGDWVEAGAARLARLFTENELTTGRAAIFGQMDGGAAYAVLTRLKERLPGLELIGRMEDSVLLTAMATKDETEINRIRQMGRVTTEVIAETADFLTGHSVRGEVLIQPDGTPLSIGMVKKKINLWLAERGAENPEATIFAIGRDGGVPHSTGTDSDLLRLGRSIVYDIFPCESGGGYFYDMTRTWCLGYAPDPVLKLYEDVRVVFEQLHSEFRLGAPAGDYQIRCCELFEARGHPTVQSDPQTTNGYVHALGHGVGLNIHEYPTLRATAPKTHQLEPGMVITLEPGLYYPEREMGVRLEDTFWARPDGVFEPLANYPMDLVLPMKY